MMGVPDNSNHQNWSETFIKRTMISRPSERLILGESRDYGRIEGPDTTNAPNGFAYYPHTGKRMNILYVDFHVGDGQFGKMGNNFAGSSNPLFGGIQ